MIQRIAGAGHQIKLFIRPIGNHICHLIGNLRISLLRDLDHTLRKIHSTGLNTISRQNLAEHARAAGQIQAFADSYLILVKPGKQLFAEGLGKIVPTELIVYFTECVTVHKRSSVSLIYTAFHTHCQEISANPVLFRPARTPPAYRRHR